MGFVLTGIVFVAVMVFLVKTIMAYLSNNRARFQAAAERGRMQRENPNSPDAQLSDAEFAVKLVKQYPLVPMKPLVIMLLLACVGLPVSCAAGAMISLGSHATSR